MLPEMRAAADKLVLDVANLRYIVSLLDRKDAARRTPGGWPVHQVLGHIALSLGANAGAVDDLLKADSAAAVPGNGQGPNVERAVEAANMPLQQVMALLAVNRDRCIERYGRLREDELSRPVVGDSTLLQVMHSWLAHIEEHALDLADGLPQLRLDPMVLNWLLWADFAARPHLFARQQKLAQEARDRYGNRLPDPDEEDE